MEKYDYNIIIILTIFLKLQLIKIAKKKKYL